MADPLIKSVNQTPRVRDALKKPEPEQKGKRRAQKKQERRKDRRRIIDTYA